MVERKTRFKEGQRVKIARSTYRCSGCGENHGRYYHGGEFNEVPFETRAKVIAKIDDESIQVRLSNGKEWTFQPAELDSLTNLIEPLRGIESIDTHPVLELASQTPIYVVNGKVYADKDEVGTVESLDELALSRIDGQLESVRKNYVAQVWKDIGLESKLGSLKLDTPNLIAAQVLPYLRGEAYNGKVLGLVGHTLEEQQAINQAEGDKLDTSPLLREILKEIQTTREDAILAKVFETEEVEERTKKQSLLDNLLGYIPDKNEIYEQGIIQAAVGRENFAIVNGEVKYLVAPKMIADVNIPGVGKFDFGNSIDIANVDENYRRVVSQLVRKQTLDTKFSSEEIEKVLAEKAKGLGRFVGVENYEEENAGFTFHKDQYYAYIKIPAMAIKSKDGNYYLYAETKAAIQVYSEDGKLQYNGDRGSNLGIHNNGHPFFHNKGDYTWLCLGDARLPTEGKNNGEVIAKRLLRLKEILMFGVESQYFDPISEPFRYEKNIRQYVRSFEEVQRLGVPIVEAKK